MKKSLSHETLVIPLDDIDVNEGLNFIKEPVKIMDREVKKMKQSRIPIVKVRLNTKQGPEFTWDHEDQMKSVPNYFQVPRSPVPKTNFRTKFFSTGE